MPRSPACVEAQKKYMAKIRAAKNGPVYEKIKQYNRKAFAKRYNQDEEFRLAKNKYCRERAYYKNEDGTLRALRYLFGYEFYGR